MHDLRELAEQQDGILYIEQVEEWIESVVEQIDNLEIYFSDDCNDALVGLDDVMKCVCNGGKE